MPLHYVTKTKTTVAEPVFVANRGSLPNDGTRPTSDARRPERTHLLADLRQKSATNASTLRRSG